MTATPWTLDRILQTPKKDIMAAIKRGDGPPTEMLAALVARTLENCADTKKGTPQRPLDRYPD